METRNKVFIATSLDGFIADKNGGIDWLNETPNPEGDDMGYIDFNTSVDALLMGKNTFETVLGFGIDWPYSKPVFVLSTTLKEVPEGYEDKVFIVNGTLNEVLDTIHQKGFKNLYLDGGKTIQSFLKEDLVDDLCLTTIPVLLGEGIPLFTSMNKRQDFELVESKVYLGQIVQSHFKRKRN
ncbi:dihydrofolate reductase [Flammeovirga pectinis]|uniref:Dihydrofolate reductase n=1 Tax=Flammeovirga pectinis TaxID=2494373 RepID=A0A3Q9FJ28_9BACT|nr:dihydrofolate reductase family protein [Flammeovirga pectinis]AZQ61188.1 dihydrofolate reductase [Flammeovirga pectinis]